MKRIATIVLASFLFSTTAIAQKPQALIVPMETSKGEDAGFISIEQGRNGLVFRVRMENIPTGWHGFHIHEVGKCEGNFASSKDHFNPKGVPHGLTKGHERHAGDLPNIHADDNGRILADIFTESVQLSEGDASLIDEDGSSIIVHADPDTYDEKADAGPRIACGVISPDKRS